MSSLRPSILALQPTRLAAALSVLGIMSRELMLQAPQRTLRSHGWGVVPPAIIPLVLDLTGMNLQLVAMLLCDLGLLQRTSNSIPLLVASHNAVAVRRLIASSSLACVVVAAEAPIETIAHWIMAPVRMRPGQTWVHVTALARPRLDPRLVPLLAALSVADNVKQAAETCYLSPPTAYSILTTTCAALGTPVGRRHRSTLQWITLLNKVLSRENTAEAGE